MLYHPDRDAMRQTFYEAWDKFKQGHVLSPLEAQIVEVIQGHPEYHASLEGRSTDSPEALQVLFLHLGLHLAIRDQLRLNKPVGIKNVFEQLCARGVPALEAEHLMMGCLAEVMWNAQQNQGPIDEEKYGILLNNLTKEQ